MAATPFPVTIRRNVHDQLADHWAAYPSTGIAWERAREPGDPARILYAVAGEVFTPGQAADEFLPGGFAAAFGGGFGRA